MSGHTYTHTHTHTYTHTYIHTHTHDNYYNPRCAHAHRGLIKRMEGILTGVTRSASEGVWVPGGGIEFPCEYVLYGAKKDCEIVRQTLRKVQKSRKRKRRLNYTPMSYCLLFSIILLR